MRTFLLAAGILLAGSAVPAVAQEQERGRILFGSPGETVPLDRAGWHFRRGGDALACQIWFSSARGDDVVMRVRPGGMSASLLLGMPDRPVLPQQGDTASLSWRAEGIDASGTLWGMGRGVIGVAEIGPGGIPAASAIRLAGSASMLVVAGVEIAMPPVPPLIWAVFSQCMRDPSSYPEGTTARWEPERAPGGAR